jgi:hypothetical protein
LARRERYQADSDPGGEGTGQHPCARGEWCDGRTVSSENGERTVTPAPAYRAYCGKCETYIGRCLDGALGGEGSGMLGLYRRLHAELGEARQAEVQVHMPLGPSVPLSEAIDAHMRLMTETMCSWEERCRDIDDLSPLAGLAERPQDREEDLERSLAIISPRLSILLSLSPQEMLRVLPPWAVPEGADIIGGDGFMVRAVVKLDGESAGGEVMHLHYLARRLLLETNPPQPILPDFRCRVCERKALRRASPPWHEDSVWYWSRCDFCGDEMTRGEYDVNAKRWIAWERAHLAVPRLGGLTVIR